MRHNLTGKSLESRAASGMAIGCTDALFNRAIFCRICQNPIMHLSPVSRLTFQAMARLGSHPILQSQVCGLPFAIRSCLCLNPGSAPY